MSEQLFYLQDSRGFVGNDVLWWRKGGKGYTTDLREAETYTNEEAQHMHFARTSDIPWPKEYIDAKTRPAVDVQYIKRAEALEGTGIEIVEPIKKKPERLKCHECGSFLSAAQLWSGTCPRCGADNRP
jgi:rubrerythrin